MQNASTGKRINTRRLAVTAVLGAVASALMFVAVSVPFMPSFIQLDVSELPALIAAFSMGPVSGVAVCLIKNLVHLLASTTAGVGELCNFLLGAAFVLPAGLVYRLKKNRAGALVGALVGAAAMALLSLPVNYFITYPVYYNFLPEELILQAYQAINPGIHSILQALACFNMPFTFGKGLLDVLITFLIYKRISPIIKGH